MNERLETVAGRLEGLVNQALREAFLLEASLERETSALEAGNPEALEEAVMHKHRAARSLEALAREQAECLHSVGFASDRTGIDGFLAVWDHEGQVGTAWKRLQEVMERCRRLNQVNGGIVSAEQQRVHRALVMLRREDGRADLYDPRGQTVSEVISRPISKA